MSATTRQRRVWQTPDETVFLRDVDDMTGEEWVREFWVPANGGYVREIDARHPGTLGRQVCRKLSYTGSALETTRAGLLALIRNEYRAAMAVRNSWLNGPLPK